MCRRPFWISILTYSVVFPEWPTHFFLNSASPPLSAPIVCGKNSCWTKPQWCAGRFLPYTGNYLQFFFLTITYSCLGNIHLTWGKGAIYGFFRSNIFFFASRRSRIFFATLFFFYKNNIKCFQNIIFYPCQRQKIYFHQICWQKKMSPKKPVSLLYTQILETYNSMLYNICYFAFLSDYNISCLLNDFVFWIQHANTKQELVFGIQMFNLINLFQIIDKHIFGNRIQSSLILHNFIIQNLKKKS